MAKQSGIGEEFLGLIVLPIAGNACEHITAVFVAVKDKMDLAIGVALGSSIQVCVLRQRSFLEASTDPFHSANPLHRAFMAVMGEMDLAIGSGTCHAGLRLTLMRSTMGRGLTINCRSGQLDPSVHRAPSAF